MRFMANQEKMPDTAREENKGFNRLFMLPLALGLAGLFFQLKTQQQRLDSKHFALF